jgi:hypothetical protein
MDEDETFPKPKGDSITESKNPSDKKSERPTAKAKKYAMQIFNATLPEVSQYVKWSEKSITWTREDHPKLIPKEHYVLVVNLMIDGYDFSKCLMDGGASLNIM